MAFVCRLWMLELAKQVNRNAEHLSKLVLPMEAEIQQKAVKYDRIGGSGVAALSQMIL